MVGGGSGKWKFSNVGRQEPTETAEGSSRMRDMRQHLVRMQEQVAKLPIGVSSLLEETTRHLETTTVKEHEQLRSQLKELLGNLKELKKTNDKSNVEEKFEELKHTMNKIKENQELSGKSISENLKEHEMFMKISFDNLTAELNRNAEVLHLLSKEVKSLKQSKTATIVKEPALALRRSLLNRSNLLTRDLENAAGYHQVA